jgi:hypothetical protein
MRCGSEGCAAAAVKDALLRLLGMAQWRLARS